MSRAVVLILLLAAAAGAQAALPGSAQRIWAEETVKQAAATAQAADELGLFLEREDRHGTLPGPAADLLGVLETETVSLKTLVSAAPPAALGPAEVNRLRATTLALQKLAIEASSAYAPARELSLTLARNELQRVRTYLTEAIDRNGPEPPPVIADGLGASQEAVRRAEADLARLPTTTSPEEWTAVRQDAAHWTDEAATALAEAFLRQDRATAAAPGS